ncbi:MULTISPECIES: hypothetical protein [unclassified Microbacterium]|uniref:hypothetical protein n=1 Tax=unclassified Microbacterium TaxID=2609290 RepID=UPI0036522F1B
MSERFCIRGCKQRGVHYASCPDYGLADAYDRMLEAGVKVLVYRPECPGCAESPARDHALICDRCYGRLRGLIGDLPDLIGRLRSLADPTKATPTDKTPGGGSSSEPIAPVDAELLDALNDIVTTRGAWAAFCFPNTLEQSLDDLVNHHQHVEDLGIGFMDRTELVDGIRAFWSVADARAKWGAERRTKTVPWVDDDDAEVVLGTVPEQGDAMYTRQQAEDFVGSARTLQRWRQLDLISPVRTVTIAGARIAMFRASDLARVKAEMESKVGRPRKAVQGA